MTAPPPGPPGIRSLVAGLALLPLFLILPVSLHLQQANVRKLTAVTQVTVTVASSELLSLQLYLHSPSHQVTFFLAKLTACKTVLGN